MIDFSLTYQLKNRVYGYDQAYVSKHSDHVPLDGFAIARGESSLSEQITFVRGVGKCKADIVGTQTASLYLISSQLADALTAEGVTGWLSTPVRFEDGTATDGAFQALSVTGRCGRILYERSEVIEKVEGPRRTKWWRGQYFDPETWDGSDIFTPVDWGTVFMVSRVRELLLLYDLDGYGLEPLSAVERMILPILLRH